MVDITLTPTARTALEHYQAQARTLRRRAAVNRARAPHTTATDRLSLLEAADTMDADAAQWEALAAELQAFAAAQAEPPAGEMLL